MPRKNARKTAFPRCVADFKITDGAGYRADIRAKDFPEAGENGEFRVYRVEGDVTKPAALKAAIFQLLEKHGVQRRRVIINL